MNGRKTLTVAIKLTLGRREAGLLMVLALLVANPGRLATETLTLTTYYPSPYGVYNNLRSTADSYFAYSAGKVGVGTTAPGAMLTVRNKDDAANNNAAASITNLRSGYTGLSVSALGTGTGVDIDVGGGSDTSAIAKFSLAGTERARIMRNGNFGLGYSDTTIGGQTYKFAANGKAYFNGSVRVIQGCGGRVTTPNASCGGGSYATFIPGVYAENETHLNSPEVWGDINNDSIPDQRLYVMNSTSFYCCAK